MPLLFVLACACFVGTLSIRLVDPLVPEMAQDLATAEANVSLLATAFAVPYALVQPLLGPLGDQIGKSRVIKICLALLALASLLATVATNIETMLAARIIAGLAGGGIIPLAIASVGDHVPFGRRQVALSQLLTAMIGAILIGTIGSGFIASVIGWRGVFVITTLVSVAALLLALLALRPAEASSEPRSGQPAGRFFAGYSRVLANPRAYVCYAAVFLEGVLILGLLPFIATLLSARGAGGVFEAGLVLAGMAVGGLFYTQIAARFIRRLGGVGNLIRLGGVFAGSGFVGVALQSSWPVEMAAFALLGFGFYSIHNSLQTEATELAPDNRGAGVSLHAFFFFLGQSVGPIFYAAALTSAGASIVISIVGAAALVLALLLAALLDRPRPQIDHDDLPSHR